MKKLLLLFVAVIATSCSLDDYNSVTATNQTESLSVLDGGLLSYKDDKSFIKEYSKLAGLKSAKDVQDWISEKGHKSLLNSIQDSLVVSDSVFDKSKIIYSNALKSILNINYKLRRSPSVPCIC